jgi:hypothetical protein
MLTAARAFPPDADANTVSRARQVKKRVIALARQGAGEKVEKSIESDLTAEREQV